MENLRAEKTTGTITMHSQGQKDQKNPRMSILKS